ncbi:MAG: hypothetical protein N3A59_07230 [Thermodesulfovibrionales bacterium]|nr:hypothetical protein [Thermodesulfovibrionales bacterium]
MEPIPPKVVSAIVSAVKAYRDSQEVSQRKETIVTTQLPHQRVSLWAIVGRQDMMLQRRLWQQRMY